ncbi:MAG: lipopolysaccharide biosynthesis protein [Bacteroides sp.]|nr:lipopolysaccharide biosynthesis protein [Bacteroides sp.]MCM1378940.1 lipopolysaccharide biosynthesis protein [Bacteroides sp.]MCM1445556.1 lipopolysaccharide biosynthesis protein [Prevotella sp.]
MSFADNNKRVARNTLYLYFRMIIVILVNLYVTRVVLEQLGVSDFGVYSAVGGLVTVFTFISNSMIGSTQRFLTFELGRNNLTRLNEVFCTAISIHLGLAIAIALLCETAGVWFLNSYMNIPPGQMTAANIVLQFSIFTLFINIIQVPYNSLIIAHEHMHVYAWISLLEAAFKIGIAFALTIFAGGKLIIYAALIFLSQLIIRLIYGFYCRINFQECRYHLFIDRKLIREMASFAGWNMLMSLGWILKTHGSNVLLNVVFGPAINAAQAIATQVKSAVMGFVQNMTLAVSPQITKYYAAGELNQMQTLTFYGLKYSYLLLLVLALPISLNVNFLLGLWLGDVPPYTAIFLVFTLFESLVNTLFDTPLMNSLAATGNIRRNSIWESAVIFLIIPVSYMVFKLGAPPQALYLVSVAILLIAGIVRFYFCHLQLGYSAVRFLKSVILPAAITTCAALPVPLLALHFLPSTNLLSFIANVAISAVCVIAAAWLTALNREEKASLINAVKAKLGKR